MPALVEATDSPFIAEALSAPAPHLQALAKQLAGDPELVLAAVDALGSLSPRIRFAASRLLHIVSKRSPEALYPHFACLARLLKDKNSILRWNAMLALGNLAPADRENKLDAILEDRKSTRLNSSHTVISYAVFCLKKKKKKTNKKL